MIKEINGLYNYESVLDKARDNFKENGFILLNDFFEKGFYKKIFDELKQLKGKRVYRADRFSYEELKFSGILIDFLNSGEFYELIGKIIGKKIKEIEFSVQRFKHRDFTLIHDEDQVVIGTRLFFVFCEKWEDFGGQSVFMGDEPMIFNPEGNNLAIINVKEGMHDFVKYVNNKAGNKELIKIDGIVR